VRLEPDFARGWFELGVASIRMGEITEARAALEHLEKLDPKLGETLKLRLPPGKR
jgi:hypothetical protein